MKIVIFVSVLICGLILTGCPNPAAGSSKSTNANLNSLTVSSGTLVPAFSAATSAYTVTVFNDVSSLTLSGSSSDASASVSAPVNLTSLVATIPQIATITVRAQDGTVKTYTVSVTRSLDYYSSRVGILKYVPAGTFQRDSTTGNNSAVSAFRIGEKEITRAQFLAIMGTDPSENSYSSTINGGKDDPVGKLSWYYAIAFCNKASLAENLTPVYSVAAVNFSTLTFAAIPTADSATWNAATANWTANGYRLPAEMEWMWAAMGGLQDSKPGDVSGGINIGGYAKAFAGSNGSNLIGDYAVYGAYAIGLPGTTPTIRSNPVGGKLPNELGLFDMSGNNWEWNWDWLGTYPISANIDYHGSASGTQRIFHGASWKDSDPVIMAVKFRYQLDPSQSGTICGLRLARL